MLDKSLDDQMLPKMNVHTRINGGTVGWMEIVEGLVDRNVDWLTHHPEAPDVDVLIQQLARDGRIVEDHIWRDAPVILSDKTASHGSLLALKAAQDRIQYQLPVEVGFVGGLPVLWDAVADRIVSVPKAGVRPVGLIGQITADPNRGEIQEYMRVGIDDEDAVAVRFIGNAIAAHNARLIREGNYNIPPLYDSKIIYKLESAPEKWWDAPAIAIAGFDDCEGLAAYRAGELQAREGLNADVWTRRIQPPQDERFTGYKAKGRLFHALTRVREKGKKDAYDDPSVRLGMPVPKWHKKHAQDRRARGLPI